MNNQAADSRRRPLFYGWWIVIVGTLGMTVISGSTWQAAGTFLVALQEEFGWNRTVLSGAFALARAEGAIMGPLEGFFADRFGARRTMAIGWVFAILGFLVFATVQNAPTFYIAYAVLSLGAGMAGYLPIITVINSWFRRSRTRAMSGPLIGASAGGALMPLLAWGIVTYGWRLVSVAIGGLYAVAAVPILLVMRNRPEEHGLTVDGDSVSDPAVQDGNSLVTPSGFTARQALRTQAFWIIGLCHAGTATLFTTMSVHLVPHLNDQGFTLTKAATIVLVLTVSSGIFQFVGGWLGDKYNLRYIIFGFMSIQAVAMLFLLMVHSYGAAIIFGVVAGIGQGGRAPAMTSIRGEYFGRRAFGTIMGLSMIPMNICALIVPFATGVIFDVWGSYTGPFLFLALAAGAGAIVILFARPPKLPQEV